MDAEDKESLFDTMRMARQLDLLLAVRLKTLLEEHGNSSASDPDEASFKLCFAALKGAVADLVAQNNRILWRNLHEVVDGLSPPQKD